MKEKELLQYCRYYKGEKECPPNKPMSIWNAELIWVSNTTKATGGNESAKEFFEDMVEYYVRCGLADFEAFDDVPITLKAVVLNRFMQHNEIASVEDFKTYYVEQYRK